jgi:hypothetical protein
MDKQDSNSTGLRIAVEESLRTLPVSPVWRAQEPNSYSDMGGNVVTTARNPINQSRQRKKGTVTDLDASGGFTSDVTSDTLTWLMQGFMFADAREQADTQPLNAAAVVITGVTVGPNTYTAATGLAAFTVNALVYASGFGTSANNGLKLVTGAAAGAMTTTSTTAAEASPPAAARLQKVGRQFAAADASMVLSGALGRLTSAAVDMTTLGLVVGQWVYLGADAVGNRFANNVGFARIGAITTTYIEFDKTDWTPATESGAGKTIHLFFGTLIQNELDPDLIVRRSYQLERTLGEDDDGPMSEYVVGAVANEFSINFQQADKVTCDFGFVGLDVEQRSGLDGVKGGSRPDLAVLDAYNTANDFSRIKLALVDEASSNVTPLFAYATEMGITIGNNVSPNKALGVLGAFDTSAGTFDVSITLSAYFADVAALQAVRENASVTLDVALVKDNAGLVFDVPLLTLGNGRLTVEQDQAIMCPLEGQAAQSKNGTSLVYCAFPYLPSLAG